MRKINLYTKNSIILEIITDKKTIREEIQCFSYLFDMIIYYKKGEGRKELHFQLWDNLKINGYRKETKYAILEKQLLIFIVSDFKKKIKNIIKYIKKGKLTDVMLVQQATDTTILKKRTLLKDKKIDYEYMSVKNVDTIIENGLYKNIKT